MHFGEQFLSARCAVCGSRKTAQLACQDGTDAHRKRYNPGHMHYQCTECNYSGVFHPTPEECLWIGQQALLRYQAANAQTANVPSHPAQELTPEPSTGVNNSPGQP